MKFSIGSIGVFYALRKGALGGISISALSAIFEGNDSDFWNLLVYY